MSPWTNANYRVETHEARWPGIWVPNTSIAFDTELDARRYAATISGWPGMDAVRITPGDSRPRNEPFDPADPRITWRRQRRTAA
jgi:hypothetical protein